MSTMTQPKRQRKPRPKPPRTVRIWEQPSEAFPGLLGITVGKEAFVYWYEPLPTAEPGCQAFRLRKFKSAEPYDVQVSGDPAKCSCDCKGFEFHRHCKHVEGLLALQRAGRLGGQPR